jgi:CubicO group peptidase (beta-lactamase class C family)
MISSIAKLLVCCSVLNLPLFASAIDHFANTSGIQDFLNQRFSQTNAGMVIALLDRDGPKILSAGTTDNPDNQKINSDTVFEIGSITKTFTALLLLDMVEKGELQLDDSVSKYLPKSVKVPSRNGKEITLLNLAAQDSGLPFNANNLASGDWVKVFNAYTAQDLYAFLSGYELPVEPGAKFQYSNIGMSLLGHVMELRAQTNFDALVVNRICRPLKMHDTGVKLAPHLNQRLAVGHDENGRRAEYYDFQVMHGAGALCSTADDLLKYLAANLGFTESSLNPLIKIMQVIRHTGSPEMGNTAMPWYDQAVYVPPGSDLLGHGGGTGGCTTFLGFDKRQRRGVIVLTNQKSIHASPLGWAILQGMSLTKESGTQFVREIVGVGTALDLDASSGLLRITKVYSDSPGQRAGLSAGMLVQRINGFSVTGKSLRDCLNLMQGPEGTKVQMHVVNPERKETNQVELTKGKFLTAG